MYRKCNKKLETTMISAGTFLKFVLNVVYRARTKLKRNVGLNAVFEILIFIFLVVSKRNQNVSVVCFALTLIYSSKINSTLTVTF